MEKTQQSLPTGPFGTNGHLSPQEDSTTELFEGESQFTAWKSPGPSLTMGEWEDLAGPYFAEMQKLYEIQKKETLAALFPCDTGEKTTEPRQEGPIESHKEDLERKVTEKLKIAHQKKLNKDFEDLLSSVAEVQALREKQIKEVKDIIRRAKDVLIEKKMIEEVADITRRTKDVLVEIKKCPLLDTAQAPRLLAECKDLEEK